MNKETIRPLLVAELERCSQLEEVAYLAARQADRMGGALDISAIHRVKEVWDLARLKRAQAELQLWLADRQWEREETEETEETEALNKTLDQPLASQIFSPATAPESAPTPPPTAKRS